MLLFYFELFLNALPWLCLLKSPSRNQAFALMLFHREKNKLPAMSAGKLLNPNLLSKEISQMYVTTIRGS